jgi:hypothetical protein
MTTQISTEYERKTIKNAVKRLEASIQTLESVRVRTFPLKENGELNALQLLELERLTLALSHLKKGLNVLYGGT